jgi:predicted transcriptional regulator
MDHDIHSDLGSRERQIVETVYRLGKATVAEVRAGLQDPPSYSSVRTMLKLLEGKGHLKHEQQGLKYVYLPVVTPRKAQRSALKHLISTFFSGSAVEAAVALLEMKDSSLSDAERQRLNARIAGAEKEGR